MSGTSRRLVHCMPYCADCEDVFPPRGKVSGCGCGAPSTAGPADLRATAVRSSNDCRDLEPADPDSSDPPYRESRSTRTDTNAESHVPFTLLFSPVLPVYCSSSSPGVQSPVGTPPHRKPNHSTPLPPLRWQDLHSEFPPITEFTSVDSVSALEKEALLNEVSFVDGVGLRRGTTGSSDGTGSRSEECAEEPVGGRKSENQPVQPLDCFPGCDHTDSWKRLRGKRGFGYYLCLQCHHKWKVVSKDEPHLSQPPSDPRR